MNPRIERFLAELKQRYPNIRAHEEEDDDRWQKAMRMLRSGDLEGAEKKFEQLILHFTTRANCGGYVEKSGG